ncbi:uncharacterized protein N0V89_006288 [Didymosphaeria variabile]|uniref:tRNA synthetases class I catalytic domain-containing protein n=1 Tax=Didymosphaeria variabile TaxID=1932322 RepID=A0A9W8XMY3_9PLEO|nr:uncharacterized protein N0V89_006288 [Didymosphaeria variabile]KAJ4354551.1 hypothetical protein N0V89_006288 [Didymosphaeria variabile]
MASDGRKQPPWTPPQAQPNAQLPQLRIYNSLTRNKDAFVPVDPMGEVVTWYACGPTVYEDARLGHAKNYISTDIIRRIMKDYFGFRVKFVMNTTDIDDKIILQGRQQYLLARFKQEHASEDDSVSDSVLAEAKAAFRHYIGKNLPTLPSSTSPETYSEAVEKAYKEKVKPPSLADPAAAKEGEAVTIADLLLRAHIRTARSAAEALQAPGKLPRFFAKTNDILLPYLDALHGAEMDSNNHEVYLELSQKFERRFFKVMEALNVLAPDQLTRVTKYVPPIVRFIEQIVANGFGYATADGSVYFDIDSFEAAGHSYSRLQPIRGLKMSKSLKNYTTIRTVLSEEDWSARSLRICFLLMPWQDGIEVTDELMKAVVGWEGKLNNFFLKSLDLWQRSRSSPNTTSIQEPGIADQQLLSALDKAKTQVDAALCDSFNTSSVMRILSDLVTESNSVDTLSDQTVFLLARWVTRIVTIVGLDPEGDLNDLDRIGLVDYTAIVKLTNDITIAASTPVIKSSKPYDQVLQQFRINVKALAAQQAPPKDLLALCDQLRDVHLWNLGIYLEDRNSPQPALVRPLDKSLVEARAERESASAAKAKAKLEREAREAKREKELRERAKIDPLLMFRTLDEYSEWDESGIPTVDAAGSAVTKSKRKKLVKEWEKQKKMHEEWNL